MHYIRGSKTCYSLMSQKEQDKSNLSSANTDVTLLNKVTIKIGDQNVSNILINKSSYKGKITGITISDDIHYDNCWDYEYYINGNLEGPSINFWKDNGSIFNHNRLNKFYFSGDGLMIDTYYKKFCNIRKMVYKYIIIPQLVEYILTYSYYGPEYIKFLKNIRPVIAKTKHYGYENNVITKMITLMDGNYKLL
jgi:hypothetical protein